MLAVSKIARPWLRPVSNRSGREYSDEELVRAVQDGDDRVAAVMHARIVSVVDRTLLRVFGRREIDHDDLMQAAFEQIVLTLARRTYAGNCSLKTWAARVTANVGLNALRARRRERGVLDRNAEPTEGVSGGDLERATHARAQLRLVMEALSTMNRRRAQAVLLHDLEGYALSEISSMTGVSLAAAQSRLVRGRRELLKRLDKTDKLRTAERRAQSGIWGTSSQTTPAVVSPLPATTARQAHPVHSLQELRPTAPEAARATHTAADGPPADTALTDATLDSEPAEEKRDD